MGTKQPKRRRIRNPLERAAVTAPLAIPDDVRALDKRQREAIARGLTANLRQALGLEP